MLSGQYLKPLSYYRSSRTEPSWVHALFGGAVSLVFVPGLMVSGRLLASYSIPGVRFRGWDRMAVHVASRWLAILCIACAVEFLFVRRLVADPARGRPYGWGRRAAKLVLLGCQTWAVAATIFILVDSALYWDPSFRDSSLEPVVSRMIGLSMLLVPVLLLSKISGAIARTIRAFHSPTQCWACGYDLRGLAEPRCPECGLAFEQDETAQYPSRIDDSEEPD